ncbi:hypothetical protein GOP47_0002303 [Adiantum capillus-veneris]|uniref:C2H2-type domain-containing protein n=1 Tax=Adiantum capillus-veneris TaxID=13818 RepID=A0A9D4V9W5_ADICA|nr:hypothetical protein GOP47_0002303 [Adiantum capillus-veneris]
MLSSFRANPPSSSTLSYSPFFIANTKLLHGPHYHRPLLYGRCHEVLICYSLQGSFSIQDRTTFSRHSPFECIYTDFSYAICGESSSRFSIICKSYGVNDNETSADSSRYELYNEEPAPFRRKYDSTGISNREALRGGEGHGPSENFDRRPRSLHRSMSSLEGFGGEPSPDNGYQGTGSLNRKFPASTPFKIETRSNRMSSPLGTYGRPRSEYPARADRLHEVVSAGYEAHRSFGNLSSSGYVSPLSQGQSSSELNNSPFKNATVSVFWDLDNKPPTSSPYHAGLYLRHAASQFGSVVDMVAYANHHAFTHIPNWVREQRRCRKELDILEKKGLVQPEEPYVCNLCGRKCKNNILLKKHFKQLHEREHHKRMTRLNSLKGKKKEKYRAAMLPKTQRYKEVANPILVPKVGYGLETDLRRAGIFVKTVQYKPQAADIELKKQMADSINKGIKCICLVSDDMDFARMLADARALDLTTIVFGESRSLKRYADFWFPWEDICRGVTAQDFQESIRAWAVYHDSARKRELEVLAGVRNDDFDVEHKVFGRDAPVQKASFSAFSEEEQQDAHGSASDDDMEWSFGEEDEEFDDELDFDLGDDEVV